LTSSSTHRPLILAPSPYTTLFRSGENVTCTYYDTEEGSITVKKVTDPTTATDTFAFTGDLTGSIGNGQSIGPKSVVPGTYSTTEDRTNTCLHSKHSRSYNDSFWLL